MGHAGAGRRNMDVHAGRRFGEIREYGSQATRAVDLGGVGLVGCLLLTSTRLQSARAAVHESVR